ncbi:Hypp7709 [Branchiostoma lanceolatum]|uniref:Cleavage and polyadenylation specificity factor subunit 4 n=1 Tax=Branchiostoma lanceolatum TaxID=7740 RepID=A0A8J9Z391_BRALA|nr:Hypp7709 [Branchiostoma lanceolatum]
MASGGIKDGTSSSGVWIFVDDSNLWIEAKKLSASRRHMETYEDPRIRINDEKLQEVVADNRHVNKGTVYGSGPKKIWDRSRWSVSTHKRSGITGKEKKVDTQIVADIVELVCSPDNLQKGNTVIIITGDADILPAVRKAMERTPWKVEMRMWGSSLAEEINQESHLYPGRLSVKTLDEDIDNILFIDYVFNKTKRRKGDLLPNNAVVLVNPEVGVDVPMSWKVEMDKECLYPFRYYQDSRLDKSDKLIVVVFFLLEDGLDYMRAKIQSSSDLSLNADYVLTYSDYFQYKTVLCKYYDDDSLEEGCPYGDMCDYAHGQADASCIKCRKRGHLTKRCPEP